MNFVTQVEVIKIIIHSNDIREYECRLDKERKYNPGSFVQLTLDLVTASDIWPDSRTFSIASFDTGIMRFIIKKTGEYTQRIFNEVHIGSRFTIKYPFGDLFNKNSIHENHLFLAGGLGITPFLGLIEYFKYLDLTHKIKLFYSAKYVSEIIHFSDLRKFLGDNLEVFITKEKNHQYHTNRITLQDIERVASLNTNIYVCGSLSFNSEFKKLLIINGYSKIHMDEWE